MRKISLNVRLNKTSDSVSLSQRGHGMHGMIIDNKKI